MTVGSINRARSCGLLLKACCVERLARDETPAPRRALEFAFLVHDLPTRDRHFERALHTHPLVWRIARDIVQLTGLNYSFTSRVKDHYVCVGAGREDAFARIQAKDARWIDRHQPHKLIPTQSSFDHSVGIEQSKQCLHAGQSPRRLGEIVDDSLLFQRIVAVICGDG